MLREGHKFPLVDDVWIMMLWVGGGGETREGVLSVNQQCCAVLSLLAETMKLESGRDGELENLMDLSIPRADRSLQSERGK